MVYSSFPIMLVLEDGTKYKGWSFTECSHSIGEVVFNTGMTGYQEIMTDPSYSGQMIAFTYPEIGNTGINNEDNESVKIQVKGIIAKNICMYPSNWRKSISFIEYLLKYNIPHIFGIDTRALSKHLRIRGVMNGCISNEESNISILVKGIKLSPKMLGLDLVNQVTTSIPYNYSLLTSKINLYSYLAYKTKIDSGNLLKIVVIDLGVKHNILARLLNYHCNICVLPATSTYKDIKSHNPDGILLSNGPGDPSVINYVVRTVKLIIELTNIPIFGICMGHQILSLALGAETFKLKFGHRGLNHPSGLYKKAEITSQNHGFAVIETSLLDNSCIITHLNLNDSTIAGIVHKYKPLFSVQYHPEASPGPHDSEYLFYHFIKVVKVFKSQYSKVL